MIVDSDQPLWIFTPNGVFRVSSRSLWQSIFNGIVRRGWEKPSAGVIGWLHSRLNPCSIGSFFTVADAESFARAVQKSLNDSTGQIDERSTMAMQKLGLLFSKGPVFIRSEPPRNTLSTGQAETVYVYACPKCGFINSGSWLFDTKELGLEEIQSSVESMLRSQYCPICGSKDIVSVPFFLPPFDLDHAQDIMTTEIRWQDS
jgi:hypothetical protein